MTQKIGVLLGRLANGFQADQGRLNHIVTLKKAKRPPCPYNEWGRKEIVDDDYETWIALCGAKPGRRSVGWSYDEGLQPSCPKCVKKAGKNVP
jgi:hypothetical protein